MQAWHELSNSDACKPKDASKGGIAATAVAISTEITGAVKTQCWTLGMR